MALKEITDRYQEVNNRANAARDEKLLGTVEQKAYTKPFSYQDREYVIWADGEEPPKLAVDRHGLAEAVDPDTKVGKLAPSEIGAAYEDFLEAGGKKEGKALTSTKPVENVSSPTTNSPLSAPRGAPSSRTRSRARAWPN